MNSATALITTTDPRSVGLGLDAEILADRAVENRMEMPELELQLAIDASTVDFERNETFPLLGLEHSYTINGLADSFNDAFHEPGDRSFADYSIGLTADIPPGNQAAKARLRRAILHCIQRLSTPTADGATCPSGSAAIRAG